MKFVVILFALCVTVSTKDNKLALKSWCCSIVPEDKVEEVTYTYAKKTFKTVKIQTIASYEACPDEIDEEGEISGKSCPVYKYHEQQVPRYQVDVKTDIVRTPQSCPHEHLKCCEGFELMDGECYDADAMEQIKMLKALGLAK